MANKFTHFNIFRRPVQRSSAEGLWGQYTARMPKGPVVEAR